MGRVPVARRLSHDTDANTCAVHVVTRWDDKPRFEVVSRDGGDPYCLISDDPREIWRELRTG